MQEFEQDIIQINLAWLPRLAKWARPGLTDMESLPMLWELKAAFPLEAQESVIPLEQLQKEAPTEDFCGAYEGPIPGKDAGRQSTSQGRPVEPYSI